MLPGLIIAGLLIASRAGEPFGGASLATLLMVILVGFYAVCYSRDRGRLTVHELAIVAQAASGALLFYQYSLTVLLVPVYVAGGIALERDRRTLGDLLLTRLSTSGDRLGKRAGRSDRVRDDPGDRLTGHGDHVPERRGCRHHRARLRWHRVYGVRRGRTDDPDFDWKPAQRAGKPGSPRSDGGLAHPPHAGMVLHGKCDSAPLAVGAAHQYRRLMAGSPFSVFLSAFGMRLDGTSDRPLSIDRAPVGSGHGLHMLGDRTAAARESQAGRPDDLARRRSRRYWRSSRRPPCVIAGIRKEMHTAKLGGVTQLAEILALSAIFVSIGYGAYRFGWPAAAEWLADLAGKGHADASRLDFNNYLRAITSAVELVCLIIIGGAAAESISAERARGTWDSLLATRLDGGEILGAKMIGAVWKARGGILLLVVLWSAGLLAGSLHPLGVAAALLLLIASVWFMAALGTYTSLLSRETSHATARTMMTLIVLTGTFLFCLFSNRSRSVLMGAGSVPFVNWLCLVSYPDVAEAVGKGTFSYLTTMAVNTDERPGRVLLTYLAAVAGYAAAAAWWTQAPIGRFERLAGRPERILPSGRCDSTHHPAPDGRDRSAELTPA